MEDEVLFINLIQKQNDQASEEQKKESNDISYKAGVYEKNETSTNNEKVDVVINRSTTLGLKAELYTGKS